MHEWIGNRERECKNATNKKNEKERRKEGKKVVTNARMEREKKKMKEGKREKKVATNARIKKVEKKDRNICHECTNGKGKEVDEEKLPRMHE